MVPPEIEPVTCKADVITTTSQDRIAHPAKLSP
jgi:hypothetical protein